MNTIKKPMFITFLLVLSTISCNSEDVFIEPTEQEEVINNSEDIENEIEVFIETGTTSTVKTIIDELNGLGTITITGWLTIDSD